MICRRAQRQHKQRKQAGAEATPAASPATKVKGKAPIQIQAHRVLQRKSKGAAKSKSEQLEEG